MRGKRLSTVILIFLLLSACSERVSERLAREQYDYDHKECSRTQEYAACMRSKGWRVP